MSAPDLRALALQLRMIADQLERAAGDEWVDRKTCGLSGRAWDKLLREGLPAARGPGGKKRARRADVELRLAAAQRPVEPIKDEIDLLMEKAGIRRIR